MLEKNDPHGGGGVTPDDRYFFYYDDDIDTLEKLGKSDANNARHKGLTKFYNPGRVFHEEYRNAYDEAWEKWKEGDATWWIGEGDE